MIALLGVTSIIVDVSPLSTNEAIVVANDRERDRAAVLLARVWAAIVVPTGM